MRGKLIDFQQQTEARLRQRAFIAFLKSLAEFKRINLAASRKWNYFYFDAINKWEKESAEFLEELKREAALTIENPYQRKALQPGVDKTVFLGREQIRNQLATTIRTSGEMPLFLIQGQRRVGKTSLLNFLQTLLGNRFVVVRMDLQSSEDCQDVSSWMESLYRKFNEAIGFQAEEWQASDNWLKSWDELSRHLLSYSKGRDFKVVVAMDEYESLHEKGLSKDPAQGGHLLGAMRSFSQHQNQVAFLFTGAALFSELENPLWSNYFVHAIRLHVGYLNEADTHQLITAPVPDFGLEYRDGLPQTIRRLTEGHPALIQMICRELVATANHGDRRHVDQADLDAVLKAHILIEDNGVFSVFWNQFCAAMTMKETVRAILRGQMPTDKVSLQKLLRHEFVVEGNGGYRLRAPLFEQWVRRFDLGMMG
ncbi:MAG: ATP-binding protein [Lewinellaceae bacterium]|nr:ATP-binding protein [Lewinellaceae bacterium]